MYGFVYLTYEIMIIGCIIVWCVLVKVKGNTSAKKSFQKHRINMMAVFLIAVTAIFALLIAPGVNGLPEGAHSAELELSPPTSFSWVVIDSPWFDNKLYIESSYYMVFIEHIECEFTFSKSGYSVSISMTIHSTSSYMQRERASGILDIEPGLYTVSVTTTDDRDIDVIIRQFQLDGRDIGQITFDLGKYALLIGGIGIAVFFFWLTDGWKSRYSELIHMSPMDYVREKRKKRTH